MDFGKIIIYTSNLRIIRAPLPGLQAPPPSSPPRPRERRGGGARDDEERRSHHTETEVKGYCWVLGPPVFAAAPAAVMSQWDGFSSTLTPLHPSTPPCSSSSCSSSSSCFSSRCVIVVLVQALPRALSVMVASCPCWPIAATAPSASCAARPASPMAWRPAPAAAPVPACRWSYLLLPWPP